MLYTFSKAQYDLHQLQSILSQVQPEDAVVLWQDGVLQAVKYPEIFATITNLFILENDLQARGLKTDFKVISLGEFVRISERYYPQFAL
ncbi:sulfurtransferase complex subunit TusB [Ursidibacter arcticus]|uniref:sulfurtransferase complex subunit TusB n=1 Tax=Ursidibacter arcticus TaxID=1524965 RepID=UPI0012F9B72E|nr:sulfurtransferase complex subunit TusB [Ursidibacter arcticus]KAE9535428.1 hypothetical protein A1D25_04850 [Ursidibacter arcticus]